MCEPEDPKKCETFCKYGEELIKPGESIKTKECTEVVCNEVFKTIVNTCVAAEMDGCTMKPDFSLSYPECCNKICDKDT